MHAPVPTAPLEGAEQFPIGPISLCQAKTTYGTFFKKPIWPPTPPPQGRVRQALSNTRGTPVTKIAPQEDVLEFCHFCGDLAYFRLIWAFSGKIESFPRSHFLSYLGGVFRVITGPAGARCDFFSHGLQAPAQQQPALPDFFKVIKRHLPASLRRKMA